MMKPRKWSLVLIPDHLGVIHVGGRVGADQGPQAFDAAFSRLSGKVDLHSLCERRIWLQSLNGPIEDNHLRASDAVSQAHQATGLTVVVGGGHDHGFSHLRGLQQATSAQGGRWGCINIDAHLDVRKAEPQITSGSPFYLAIQQGVLEPAHLIEFGIQSHCNRPELWEFAHQNKISIVLWKDLRAPGQAVDRFETELKKLSEHVDHVAISLDLDALSQAHCPGVSAPQAEGFDPREVIAMLEMAARNPKVSSLGIFELNPAHDVGGATARVAATAAYHFIEGFQQSVPEG
jgi:formiminoglutamase